MHGFGRADFGIELVECLLDRILQVPEPTVAQVGPRLLGRDALARFKTTAALGAQHADCIVDRGRAHDGRSQGGGVVRRPDRPSEDWRHGAFKIGRGERLVGAFEHAPTLRVGAPPSVRRQIDGFGAVASPVESIGFAGRGFGHDDVDGLYRVLRRLRHLERRRRSRGDARERHLQKRLGVDNAGAELCRVPCPRCGRPRRRLQSGPKQLLDGEVAPSGLLTHGAAPVMGDPECGNAGGQGGGEGRALARLYRWRAGVPRLPPRDENILCRCGDVDLGAAARSFPRLVVDVDARQRNDVGIVGREHHDGLQAVAGSSHDNGSGLHRFLDCRRHRRAMYGAAEAHGDDVGTDPFRVHDGARNRCSVDTQNHGVGAADRRDQRLRRRSEHAP